jgi:Peroxidase
MGSYGIEVVWDQDDHQTSYNESFDRAAIQHVDPQQHRQRGTNQHRGKAGRKKITTTTSTTNDNNTNSGDRTSATAEAAQRRVKRVSSSLKNKYHDPHYRPTDVVTATVAGAHVYEEGWATFDDDNNNNVFRSSNRGNGTTAAAGAVAVAAAAAATSGGQQSRVSRDHIQMYPLRYDNNNNNNSNNNDANNVSMDGGESWAASTIATHPYNTTTATSGSDDTSPNSSCLDWNSACRGDRHLDYDISGVNKKKKKDKDKKKDRDRKEDRDRDRGDKKKKRSHSSGGDKKKKTKKVLEEDKGLSTDEEHQRKMRRRRTIFIFSAGCLIMGLAWFLVYFLTAGKDKWNIGRSKLEATSAPSISPAPTTTFAPSAAPSASPTDFPSKYDESVSLSWGVLFSLCLYSQPVIFCFSASLLCQRHLHLLLLLLHSKLSLTHTHTHIAPTAKSPSFSPTSSPTLTPAPTNSDPTNAPTQRPTASPTPLPTNPPTNLPTRSPTTSPTPLPTNAPTQAPTDISQVTDVNVLVTRATSELRVLIERDPEMGPKFVRLGFHDCVGFCDGCVDMTFHDNFGLEVPIEALEPITAKYERLDLGFTRADIWALSALVAADFAQEQNEEFIEADRKNFKMQFIGRQNCEDRFSNRCFGEDGVTQRECNATLGPFHHLPMADITTHDIFLFFRDEFGFDERETVAIMGAHTLGRLTRENSGIDAPNGWVRDNRLLDNEYYFELVGGESINDSQENWIELAPPWLRVTEDNSDNPGFEDKAIWEAFPPNTTNPEAVERIVMLNADIALVRELTDDNMDELGRVSCAFTNAVGGGSIPRCPHAEQGLQFAAEYRFDNDLWLNDFMDVYHRMLNHGCTDGTFCNGGLCKCTM